MTLNYSFNKQKQTDRKSIIQSGSESVEILADE